MINLFLRYVLISNLESRNDIDYKKKLQLSIRRERSILEKAND